MAIRKRKTVANYLKVNGAYELLGSGFTELNESFSPQTSSKRYINQASATQSISGYEWSTSFNADQIVSNVAIEYIRSIAELLKTGADTETEYVIVDLDKATGVEGEYYARKINVAIAVDSTDDNDGELGNSGNFLGQSDPVEGIFNVTTKTFSAGPYVGVIGTLTVNSIAGLTTGNTKVTVAPTLISGNGYMYKTAASVTAPLLNDVIGTGYTAWNGISEITATTGNKILIVEIDSNSKAKKAGIATVASKA
jgi:hypothetical protein